MSSSRDLIPFLYLCSSCRRSVIEAVYNRLNPYREEDGVSVRICDEYELCPSLTIYTTLAHKSYAKVLRLHNTSEISSYLLSLSFTYEFLWSLKTSYVDSSRLDQAGALCILYLLP